MKVAIIIKNLLVGGAQKQSILLAKALKNSHDVIYVVLNVHNANKAYIRDLEHYKIEFYLFNEKGIFNFFKLSKLIKKKQIKVVFTYLVFDNLIGSLLKIKKDVKFLIGGVRNDTIPFRNFIFLKFLNNYVHNYTLFNNYSGRDKFVNRGFNNKKSIVIENCFVPSEINKTFNTNNCIQILSVGRFVKQKDYETAIKSINHLKKLLTNLNKAFHYTIIGYGTEFSVIKNLITKFNLTSLITLITNGNKISLNRYYAKADIFLNTSIFEGTSNSIMEAMGCGLPIVATNVGDNNRLVKNEFNGYITKIKNYEQIAEKLLKLINNDTLRKEFSTNSYTLIKENYSFEKFQNKYLELLNSLKNNEAPALKKKKKI